MIFLSKFSFCSTFTLLVLFCSCNSQKVVAQNKIMQNKIVEKEKTANVGFEEMRRLNFKINLKEITVLKEFQEILDLYQKFDDPKYGRGYPIPSLQDGESIIVIKPELKQKKFGDIEIESIKKTGNTLVINYKEVENWEYAQNKTSDPILIIKIQEKFKNIKLTINS